MNDQLIPGLPNDIAHECLLRIPYNHLSLSKAAFVCKGWKVEIELPEFLKHRKAASYSQSIIVLVQARVNGNPNCQAAKYPPIPVYGLTIYEPRTATWSELPLIPGLSNGLPMFCRLVGVGSDLVVTGGWDPKAWIASSNLYIYNFVSATWRCRGVDLPGVRRSFFGRRPNDVATLEKDTSNVLAQLPAELGNVTNMTAWQDKFMVIGSSSFGVPHMAYMLDLKNYKWTKVELPEEYSGYVQSSSYLEI